MKAPFTKFYHFLEEPLKMSGRMYLALLIVPLLLSFVMPLWNINMRAPQYPDGLDLDIYLYKVEGGNDGHDVTEINTLNHYIGMSPINEEQLADLGWLPFAIGLLAIITLRCAVIGNVRILIDLMVLSLYVCTFALGRFIFRMWVLGHALDPHAPVRVEGFTPAIFGTKQIANFTVSSYPRGATAMITLFVLGVTVVAVWHLWSGRRAAVAEAALEAVDRPHQT